MQALRREINDLAQEIREQREVEDGESIQAAMDIISDVADDMTRLQEEQAYQQQLIETLKTEKDRLDAGVRDDPLCTCSDPYCALKRGTLPAPVRMADQIDDGITDYKTDHMGDPRVLLDARTQWLEKGHRVRERLQTAVLVIRGELDHDPQVSEADVSAEPAYDDDGDEKPAASS